MGTLVSPKEPKQLHGRKERIPSPDPWPGVLDHLLDTVLSSTQTQGVVHGTLSSKSIQSCMQSSGRGDVAAGWVMKKKARWEKDKLHSDSTQSRVSLLFVILRLLVHLQQETRSTQIGDPKRGQSASLSDTCPVTYFLYRLHFLLYFY